MEKNTDLFRSSASRSLKTWSEVTLLANSSVLSTPIFSSAIDPTLTLSLTDKVRNGFNTSKFSKNPGYNGCTVQ